MAERKSLSKKIRFEVFKRDSFTCQYCGKSAPEVVLEIDHINPVANGGLNDIMNLVTACYDCNRGKSKNLVSDNTVITKQKEQLDLLNEKRNQLKLMIDWRKELQEMMETQIDQIDSMFQDYDESLTEIGRKNIGQYIKKFGFEEVIISTEISFEQYYHTHADTQRVFDYIPKICNIRKRQKEDPLLQIKMYIRKIVLNNFEYKNKSVLNQMLDAHIIDNNSAARFQLIAQRSRNWTQFVRAISKEFEDNE